MENMKSIIFVAITCSLFLTGCVQKTKTQKVVYTLDVSGIKNIQSVGVRGADQPLSWETDLLMKPIIKDSLYRAEVTYITGYKITEVKFTVNGNFELQNQENRKIRFDEKQSVTKVKAVFNQMK
jgi:putative oxidoreductase